MRWDKKIRSYGISRLAADLGLSKQAVSSWVINKKIPAERVLEVEFHTGIGRTEMRPDLYFRQAKRK